MKTNFVAQVALALLILILSNCTTTHKKQQVSSRPSLSTLAKADPLQLGYHEMSAGELLGSHSIRLLPEGREAAVTASFLQNFIVFRNDENQTIYIRRRHQSPTEAYSYLMRSFDYAGNGTKPLALSPGIIFECHETLNYGAIGTTYLSHAIGEAGGSLIIRNDGKHSYLAGEELECALSLSESANEGLVRASNSEPTGWLRSF